MTANVITLVVVESPNKVEKVKKCLGLGYEVVATVGHFRDLPADELGVGPDFLLRYVVSPEKRAVVSKLRDAQRRCGKVLLATDADREGEAISWHVAQELQLRAPLRLRFQEITATGLKRGLETLTPLDQHLVDAQQARRTLDRLVGFQVSPLLAPLGSNHSAGRVQSAALHLVVARELARDGFKGVPFWTLRVTYEEGFVAVAAARDASGNWSKHRFPTQSAAEDARAVAQSARHRVEAVVTERVERRPRAPFTTSSLQQAASARFSLTPKRTMEIAQRLFEEGLITYHRTDSVVLSTEAIEMARSFLETHLPLALPEKPVTYRSGSAAQEAHEAIRPTSLSHTVNLRGEELDVYELVRARFIACQCKPALVDRTTVRTDAEGVAFLATGDVVVFESWLTLVPIDEHTEAQKHEHPDESETRALPKLQLKQSLRQVELETTRAETKPLPRFTEATLVREMEKTGIGRPSTYAATLATLFERKYIEAQKKAVAPTARGRIVDGVLTAAFPSLVEATFTADMERQLDLVASGELQWKRALQQWHPGFVAALSGAPAAIAAFYNAHQQWIDSVSDAPKRTGKKCPRCATELLLRKGKNGEFLSCAAYPKCDFSCSADAEDSTLPCPVCRGVMVVESGKFGVFRRCVSAECGHRVDEARRTEHVCPRCQRHQLQDKVAFLACEERQSCGFTVSGADFAASLKRDRHCPDCMHLLIVRHGARGRFLSCSTYPRCKHTEEFASASTKASARRVGATR